MSTRSAVRPVLRQELPSQIPPSAGLRLAISPTGTMLVSTFWSEAGPAGANEPAAAPRLALLGEQAETRSMQSLVVGVSPTGALEELGHGELAPVIAECDEHGQLYVFDARVPAPLEKFGAAGSPLGYARVRMLGPEADVAVTADQTLYWACPIPELCLQRFDAEGEGLGGVRLSLPEPFSGFLPCSVAVAEQPGQSVRLWLAGRRATGTQGAGSTAVLSVDADGRFLGALADDEAAGTALVRLDHRGRLWLVQPDRGRVAVHSVRPDQPARLLGTVEAGDLSVKHLRPVRIALRGPRLALLEPAQIAEDGSLRPACLHVCELVEP